VKNEKADTTENNSISDEPGDTISDKSKRIKKKRDQAKERNKSKLDLDKIDKKFIPEGFYDPNLDEQTRKKMIQMIRNRASAQASRDKKKLYMQQLESENQKLHKQNASLMSKNSELNNRLKALEYSYAQLAQENQELKQLYNNLSCHKCGAPQVINAGAEYTSTDDREEAMSQSSENSPIRGRGYGFRSSFFNMAMTFATILSVVLMVFMGGNISGSYDQRDNRIGPMRYLAEKPSTNYFISNDQIVPENNLPIKVQYNEIPQMTDIAPQEAIFMENIKTVKREFQLKYDSVYKARKQTIIVDPKDNATESQSFTGKNKNALVDYKFYQPKKFLGKANKIIGDNDTLFNKETKVTTLFSPHTFEFKDQQDKERDFETNRAPTSEIPHSKFIQLLITKSNNHISYLGEDHSEFHAPIISQDDHGTMYELWCEVFYVRELNTF